MSELARLAQQFAEGLLGQSEAILPHIHSRLFTADAVLQVYRNHFILSLEVLAGNYPAVKAMVGEAFFDAAARGFVLAEPLICEGSVMHYGAGFGDWLARLPTTANLPWLGSWPALSGHWSAPVCWLPRAPLAGRAGGRPVTSGLADAGADPGQRSVPVRQPAPG